MIIRGAQVVTPGRSLGVVDVVLEGERIVSVGACADAADGEVIDAAGLTLLPGFVDIHSHGRGGADFCDLTDAAFEKIGSGKLKDGVTSFLATGLTRPEEDLAELCRCTERYKARCAFHGNAPTGAGQTGGCSSANCTDGSGGGCSSANCTDGSGSGCSSANCTDGSGGGCSSANCTGPDAFRGATCLGVHLEGPFFNQAMAGAQNPAYLKNPDADLVLRLHAISPIVKISLAPELPGAEECIRRLAQEGIVVSLGHSDANYATFEQARAAGATHLTHFCNAMMPVHHLRPSMVTGGLLADDVYAEIITDGVHLSDPMIRLIAKNKGADRLMIITDAMCAAGEPDGIYSLGGLRVKVEKGKATLADVPYDPKAVVSNVAGSVALFPQCFKRFVAASGLPFEEAVKAAGYNQLRSLGITDRGEIAEGQVADLVLLNADLDPVTTIVNGEIRWQS